MFNLSSFTLGVIFLSILGIAILAGLILLIVSLFAEKRYNPGALPSIDDSVTQKEETVSASVFTKTEATEKEILKLGKTKRRGWLKKKG